MTDRRTFLQATGFSAAAAACGLPRPLFAALAQEGLSVKRIVTGENLGDTSEDPGVWLIEGGGGNVLLIGGSKDGGPIMVDAMVGTVAWALGDVVKSRAKWDQHSQPQFTLINTHHHGDHIGGNFLFRNPKNDRMQSGRGRCQIIAHQNAGPRIEETVNTRVKPGIEKMAKDGDERAKAMLPQLSFDRFQATTEFADTHTITRKTFTLSLHHFGPGHTDNDIIVGISRSNPEPSEPGKPAATQPAPGSGETGVPEVEPGEESEKRKVILLHMGDLLFHRHHPFIDRPAGADTRKWQHCLKEAMKHCDKHTFIIPGHGDLTNKPALTLMHDYFDALREAVQHALKQDKSREEILALSPAALPEPFRDYGFTQIWPRTLKAVYEEEATPEIPEIPEIPGTPKIPGTPGIPGTPKISE